MVCHEPSPPQRRTILLPGCDTQLAAHMQTARSRDGGVVFWLHVVILFTLVPAIAHAAASVRRHQYQLMELTDVPCHAIASHLLFTLHDPLLAYQPRQSYFRN
jgi:hypothetical protein